MKYSVAQGFRYQSIKENTFMEVSKAVKFNVLDVSGDRNKEVSIFSKIIARYDKIYVIVSPPRCSSTAFARVFWEQPSIGYYSHEPFEVTYYKNLDLSHVVNKLENPLVLKRLKNHKNSDLGEGLVIKEMSFQVGKNFALLAALTQEPIIFMLRDPRLNIASRMAKKQEQGDNPIFPFQESGWEFLLDQIEYCQQKNLPYIVVDATDFRNNPKVIFKQVFAKLKLPFDREMLSWRSCENVEIDNLDGQQSHWYERVLTSTNIQPATETIPAIDSFPTTGGFRDRVLQYLDIYKMLCNLPERIASDR